MAAYGAASTQARNGQGVSVTVLEKMPRPARKIMITGKGRCNFSNIKDWNAFSGHIRTNPQFLKPAFFNLPPEKLREFFLSVGMESVVERGDRAFPASHLASDVVDALVRACHGAGVKIETEAEVKEILLHSDGEQNSFSIICADGRTFSCKKLILATGGLSYPGTGSTGDGYAFARNFGHGITPLFPSLTALIPRNYKKGPEPSPLCGVKLKNVGLQLLIDNNIVQDEFGDLDFTDGGIEGPIGFKVSRKAVKALTNGAKVALVLDLKPGVEPAEIAARVKDLWKQIADDPRSRGLRDKERFRILLGKLMPRELIPGFMAAHQGLVRLERRGRTDTKVWIDLAETAKALKAWRFDIEGNVGYERAVVTAGGVSTDEVIAKTLESRLVGGLYLCGELLDIDADTGGYNLQAAFSTGYLAGQSAAKALPEN